jgi:hypothetical protein
VTPRPAVSYLGSTSRCECLGRACTIKWVVTLIAHSTCHRSSGALRKRCTEALGGRFETAFQEAKRLSFRLLGLPELSLQGHPLRFGIKKQLALLCYLAAQGGRRPRGELAELLWPGSEERHARGDLRSVLSKLRKTLREESAHDGQEEEAHFLLIDGDILGVEPTQVELDTEALEAAVSLARRETSPASSSASAGHSLRSTGTRTPFSLLEQNPAFGTA